MKKQATVMDNTVFHFNTACYKISDNMNSKAIILVSGGIDSATSLAIAKHDGYDCYALTFDYGQRQRIELRAAENVAQSIGVKEHRIFNLPIGQFGGSALTDTQIDVPRHNHSHYNDIPITYVPARNTIFLAVALGWAEALDAQHIFIGVSAVDSPDYPDCRPEYMQAFQAMADLATKKVIEGGTIKIDTPLIQLDKAQPRKLGTSVGVDYSITVTCYKPTSEGEACGQCTSCVLRMKGFQAAGINDPTLYV